MTMESRCWMDHGGNGWIPPVRVIVEAAEGRRKAGRPPVSQVLSVTPKRIRGSAHGDIRGKPAAVGMPDVNLIKPGLLIWPISGNVHNAGRVGITRSSRVYPASRHPPISKSSRRADHGEAEDVDIA